MKDDEAQALEERDGFAVCTLRSRDVELSVVPELGARLTGLRSLRTGRQWMWQPPGAARLFRNRLGDAFDASPLAGADECLPTVTPCRWNGRSLNDHGEVWCLPWRWDRDAWHRGDLRTVVALPSSPFVFERTIRLDGNVVDFDYRLTNCSAADERYLWAFHPLFAIAEGDRVSLPANVCSLRGEMVGFDAPHAERVWDWPEPMRGVRLDRLDLGSPNRCCKLFAEDLAAGEAALANPRLGERLVLQFDTRATPALGLWLSRGGWNGHHHLALEPTNAAANSLADAAARRANGATLLAGGATRAWTLRLRMESM